MAQTDEQQTQAASGGKIETQRVFNFPTLHDKPFVFRRTKVSDKFTIAQRQSVYLRGLNPAALNRESQDLSYICATLGTVMVEPTTFDFTEVVDENALIDMFGDWDKWNSSFRSPVRGGSEPAS